MSSGAESSIRQKRTEGDLRPRVGIVVFPGSNDDRDMARALGELGAQVEMVWHKDRVLPEGVRGLVIPGGFSYGDYLRAGSMARFSPVMRLVEARAAEGTPVLGICNGFQILCEAGLLPGALLSNRDRRFVCREVRIRIEDTGCFDAELSQGGELSIPIKHAHGAYTPQAGHATRVAFRYLGPNPNGSVEGIAGVVNEAGNVVGLMPHAEHAVDPLLGSTDGRPLLASFLSECDRVGTARA